MWRMARWRRSTTMREADAAAGGVMGIAAARSREEVWRQPSRGGAEHFGRGWRRRWWCVVSKGVVLERADWPQHFRVRDGDVIAARGGSNLLFAPDTAPRRASPLNAGWSTLCCCLHTHEVHYRPDGADAGISDEYDDDHAGCSVARQLGSTGGAATVGLLLRERSCECRSRAQT